MFKGIKNSFELIKVSFKTFRKHPVLAVPIFIVWLIYAPLIVYFKWHFDWDMYNYKAQLMIVFLILYFLAFILSISCSTMLELIQQKETGSAFNLLKAFGITMSYNLAPILVLSLVWAIIWFVLVVLKALTKRRGNTSEEENAENMARTLAPVGDGSLLSFSIDALIKGIRMIAFLIIPAFAWENMGIRASFRRGYEILRQRRWEFIAGFTLSLAVEFVVFLPAGIMFYLSDKGVIFPDWSWFVCIFYIGLAWSYSIYLEQMFAAELYLWQMTYEKEFTRAAKNKTSLPNFAEVRRPSIVDNIPDMKP